MLGYQVVGTGSERVVMLHDWFSDTSNYNHTLPYFNQQKYQYALIDLRGYGRSRELRGDYSTAEAAADVLEVTQHLGWQQFHLLGHSMSGMFAQYIAATQPERIKSLIAVTPVPACGSLMPPEVVASATAASLGDDEALRQFVHFATGNQLADGFAAAKIKQFRASSTHEARMGYRVAFSQTDFSDKVKGCLVPTLVIAARHDAPAYGPEAMKGTLLQWFPNSKLCICEDSGHFPMQETPALFAAYVERWLGNH